MSEKNTATTFLYLSIAHQLEEMIEQGVFEIGNKLPSVRALSREQGVSVSTAFQAYYYLEGKGLIESRPKSGYYVRFNRAAAPDLPPPIYTIRSSPNRLSIDEMLAAVFGDMTSENVLRFSMGSPDNSLLPVAKLNKSVRHAIATDTKHCLNYEDIQGSIPLRRQLSKLAFNWGGHFSEKEIVVTAGCMEAVALCLESLTKPGDRVAVESPTYFGILQLLQSLQLETVEIPTDPTQGVDLAFLEEELKSGKTKVCLFVPNFSNPLTALMPEENKIHLIGLLEKYEAYLIENDLYGELYFGKQRPRTCKSYDRNQRVLYCTSISKCLAPGYRIGWTIPGPFIDTVINRKLVRSVTTATLTQKVIQHFLETGRFDLHLKKLRKALHLQALRYLQAITQFFPKNIKITAPKGSLYYWIVLDERINTFDLHQKALEAGISIAPGQLFSASNEYKNCFRLSFGLPFDERVEEGLKTLGKIIEILLQKDDNQIQALEKGNNLQKSL